MQYLHSVKIFTILKLFKIILNNFKLFSLRPLINSPYQRHITHKYLLSHIFFDKSDYTHIEYKKQDKSINKNQNKGRDAINIV